MGRIRNEFITACVLASLADDTPEGKSIVELAAENNISQQQIPSDSQLIEFTAETRSSGIDLPDGTSIRKGAFDAIKNIVIKKDNAVPEETAKK